MKPALRAPMIVMIIPNLPPANSNAAPTIVTCSACHSNQLLRCLPTSSRGTICGASYLAQ
jgi:hypothetical protein